LDQSDQALAKRDMAPQSVRSVTFVLSWEDATLAAIR
jgi:hypothetical protein